ncbi:MAG TPA: DUF4184 family protein [Steroidobacteraceae bacterium]|jgi:hypothetical protein|nr:DUF4184 family protein [Steroidobacteraceae bacterium]
MPFTVSHVAAVLPAYRLLTRWRVFTAAVIGSMVPDFSMLLPGGLERWQTHSLPGLLNFSLPMGLLIYLLTQVLIRPAIVEILPDAAYVRLTHSPPAPSLARLSSCLSLSAALLFGALTHLIWDGFTHENSRGVRLFPQLLNYGPNMAGHQLRLYVWMQYGSSVVGLAVVLAALAVWLRHAPTPASPPVRHLQLPERVLWILLYVTVPLAALVGHAVLTVLHAHVPLLSRSALEASGVAGMRGAAVSLLLISALVRARLAARA